MARCALLVALVALLAPAASLAASVVNTTLPGRLPLSVIPSTYDILLNLFAPDSSDFAASPAAEVQISANVVVETTCIVFHAASSITLTSIVTSLQLLREEKFSFLRFLALFVQMGAVTTCG